MVYLIIEECVGCKDASCAQVCPVEAIRPLPNEPAFTLVDRLFVDPVACVDCGACEPECPIGAVWREADLPGTELEACLAANNSYFAVDPEGPP